MLKDKFVLGMVLLTIVFLVGGVFLINKRGNSLSSNSANSGQVSEEQKKLLAIAPDDYIKGNQDANVTLVEYLDFECEACAAYYPLVKQLVEEYNDDIRVVNRYFPLPGHKNGMSAALAVEAAAQQGKYWEMHDKLYEEQKNWGEKTAPDPQIFEGYAQQLGLNLEQFKKDVAAKEVKDRVGRDKNTGIRLAVAGTPTFFLNGEKIPNPRSLEDFKTFINAAILKTSQPSGQ